MSVVINLLNLKGGVGKTVSSINLACALKELGKKVLILDSDSQGNIATSMGKYSDKLEDTLANLMSEMIDADISLERIQKCIITLGNIDVLPSNSMLAGLDYRLMNAYGREYIIKSITDKLKDVYEYIIIDCPPSLGLIVINALVASDYTLIPVEAQYLSFESLGVMVNTIKMVKMKLNPNLNIAGIFLTKYQERTNMSKGIKSKIKETYGEEIKVFEEHIPYSIKAAEQTLYGKSLIELNPNHPVSKAYRNIAKELVKYGE